MEKKKKKKKKNWFTWIFYQMQNLRQRKITLIKTQSQHGEIVENQISTEKETKTKDTLKCWHMKFFNF